MKKKKLILVGGGGHCKSVIDVAECAGFNVKGILDISENVGKPVLNYTIVGTDEQISDFVKDHVFVVTVGQIENPYTRIKLHEKIKSAGGELAIIIASTAHVSKYALLGEGSVVMHNAVVNADAKIGKGCIINTFANIEHDAEIGDFCHISTGVMVNGNCKVGSRTFIGSQAVLANGLEIAAGCFISAGSMVRKSIFEKGVYAGNPAELKKRF